MKPRSLEDVLPAPLAKGQDYTAPLASDKKSATSRDFDKALFGKSDSAKANVAPMPSKEINEWHKLGSKSTLDAKRAEAPMAKKSAGQAALEDNIADQNPENLVNEEWSRLASGMQKTPADVKKWGQLLLDAGNLSESAVLPLLANSRFELENIDVTAVLQESGFLSEAMGQDLDVFFATPIPIRKLLAGLDLDVSLLDLGAKYGLDPNQKTTPTNFFKALGVDPDTVKSQINALKDKLGPNKFAFIPKAAEQHKQGPKLAEGAAAAAKDKPAAKAPSSLAPVAKKAAKIGETPLAPLAGQPTTKLPGVDVAKNLPKATGVALKGNGPSKAKPAALDLAPDLGLVSAGDLKSPLGVAGVLESLPELSQENVMRWDTLVRAGELPAKIDGSQAVVDKNGLLFNQGQHGLDLAQVELASRPEIAKLNLEQMAREGSFAIDNMAIKSNEKIEDGAKELAAESFDLNIDLAKMPLAEITGEKRSEAGLGQEKDEDAGLNQENTNFEPSLAPLGHQQAFDGLKPEAPRQALAPSNELRQELVDKIIENANLAKASNKNQATLQFDDKTLGRISMQIQVDGQEVKIKTNHDQGLLRDWLGSDFGELKESLSRQNLKLVHVETSHDYGQNQDSMWRFGQGHQDKKPFFLPEDSDTLAIKKPLKQYAKNIAINPGSLSLNSRHIQLAV